MHILDGNEYKFAVFSPLNLNEQWTYNCLIFSFLPRNLQIFKEKMDYGADTQNLDHENSPAEDNERYTPTMRHWVHLNLDVKESESTVH